MVVHRYCRNTLILSKVPIVLLYYTVTVNHCCAACKVKLVPRNLPLWYKWTTFFQNLRIFQSRSGCCQPGSEVSVWGQRSDPTCCCFRKGKLADRISQNTCSRLMHLIHDQDGGFESLFMYNKSCLSSFFSFFLLFHCFTGLKSIPEFISMSKNRGQRNHRFKKHIQPSNEMLCGFTRL